MLESDSNIPNPLFVEMCQIKGDVLRALGPLKYPLVTAVPSYLEGKEMFAQALENSLRITRQLAAGNPPSFLPIMHIPAVLHFFEDRQGDLVLAKLVKTHNGNMGDYAIGADSQRLPAWLSWQMHGQPCEQQSLRFGGDPYPFIYNSDLLRICLDSKLPYPTLSARRKEYWQLVD